VEQVELLERVAVAFLRPRYEETQVDRCAVAGSRRCPVHHLLKVVPEEARTVTS
jgi:hypothetical protein